MQQQLQVLPEPPEQQLQVAPELVPNLRDLSPTQLRFLADWQRDRDEQQARLLQKLSWATLQRWESTSIPFSRACVALRSGKRLQGLDLELVENEAPHLILDALRESRDPENRGADRATNRRLLLEVGKRIGGSVPLASATVYQVGSINVQLNQATPEQLAALASRVLPQLPAPPQP